MKGFDSQKSLTARVKLTRKDVQRKTGEVIRELRLEKNLTQEQAADNCGCTLEEWGRWEQEGVQSVHVLLKLSVFLAGSFSSITRILERKVPLNALSKNWTDKGFFHPRLVRNMNLQEIKSFLAKEERPWVREKLQALACLAEGMKTNDVAKKLGRRGGLIQHWLWRYYKKGIGWALNSHKHTQRTRADQARTRIKPHQTPNN